MNDAIISTLSALPTELAATLYAAGMVICITLLLYVGWRMLDLAEWLIDRSDRAHQARQQQARSPVYRTASERQIERDLVAMWHRHPGFENTFPGEQGERAHDKPRPRHRAGQPTVVSFPAPEQRRPAP